MKNAIRTIGMLVLTAVASYVVAEWALIHKAGLHDLRDGTAIQHEVSSAVDVPHEPERLALQAQVDRLEETFGAYRSAKEREIADLLKLVANLERQIRALTAQRTPVEQVTALREASRPVRWQTEFRSDSERVDLVRLAKEAGFTRVEVRR